MTGPLGWEVWNASSCHGNSPKFRQKNFSILSHEHRVRSTRVLLAEARILTQQPAGVDKEASATPTPMGCIYKKNIRWQKNKNVCTFE